MRTPFTDSTAVPLPGLPVVDVCPRAGVLNPAAYNAVEADESLVAAGISPGDDVYVLSTADVRDGDLAAVRTPNGVLLRFVEWFADPAGKVKLRLSSAHPELTHETYDYDDDEVRTRWRAVWVCRHGDHTRCSAFRQEARAIC